MDQRVRETVSVEIGAETLAEARALGVDLSQAAEAGLRAATKAARAEKWRADNAAAIDWWNRWVEENGIPLAEYRQF